MRLEDAFYHRPTRGASTRARMAADSRSRELGTGLVLDSALANLASRADRSHGEEGRIKASPWTGPESDQVLDDLAADAAEARGTAAGTSVLPAHPRAGVPNPPLPGDSSTQQDRPEDRGGVLARLAVGLLAAGLWGHGAGLGDLRFRTRRSRELRHTIGS